MTLRNSDLSQFTGSDNFYKHWMGKLVYTDGVRYLAEEGGAYWLLDAIASYQSDNRILSHSELRDFQLWELAVGDDKTATLTLRVDSDKPASITQEIQFTDFPLEYVKLYVWGGVLLLPSEY